MIDTLADTSIILDVVEADQTWFEWSSQQLAAAADRGKIILNQIVYAELAVGFSSLADLEAALAPWPFERESLPFDAAFLAGFAYLEYRRRGGAKTSPLPDFFIGAHAAVQGYKLLTRDRGYYASYFPTIDIVSPGKQP
ncbi:type II toxin-antitoxin system VapC family toxin [Kaistia dalseonensis]|uniref:Nucleic acid-binding protein n=1 Tax=Kaistia dalseonensis TaxID=410840 RepID=A0ABU0HBC1_9HYPH|nr:type II toxin-antitoxin system VapC family toxin [Kaistia dalseonensis]MCX5496546.1 type II toxin-antitoxin system VapC family toxin [Kaistia dalseonensis]MDQ0439168.1 putative nucleic acid-binding protein [Kaistia dalseonensis]